eukprot:scaffold44711_cov21-Tisochrysis_lutea.AAC.1
MTQAGRSCSIESELQTAGLWTFESLWCERGVSRCVQPPFLPLRLVCNVRSAAGNDAPLPQYSRDP